MIHRLQSVPLWASAIAFVLVLAGIAANIVLLIVVWKPQAFWGPTPAGWWLLFAVLGLLAVPLLLQPQRWWSIVVLAGLLAICLPAVVFVSPGVEVGIGVIALAFAIAALMRWHRVQNARDDWSKTLGVAGSVAILALGCFGLATLLQQGITITWQGSSPDGYYKDAAYYGGGGALSGSGGDVLMERHDYLGLVRHEIWH